VQSIKLLLFVLFVFGRYYKQPINVFLHLSTIMLITVFCILAYFMKKIRRVVH